MGWLSESLNSSIGKKFVVALTGILLMIYLVIHLVGNLFLYGGHDAFNNYAGALESLGFFIRIIEVLLALVFIFHILNGFRLWLSNKGARPVKYAIKGSSKNTDLYSRTTFVSGSIIFIFLWIHLQTIWYPFRFSPVEPDLYMMVTSWFSVWWYSLIYIGAMVLLGFHLTHGFQSAFQTLGLNHKKYFPIIEKIGIIYTLIITIGFVSIPVYFLFFYGGN